MSDSAERGARLAAWLEDLGLAGQLEAAGLPTYVRRADGSVTWTEPGSDAPVSCERLEQLDALLHAEGDDPSHAVPVGLVALRRQARVRAALLDGGWLSYAGVGERRGVSENAARFAVHRAHERHALLLVQDEGRTLVPVFQLDENGEVRPELLAVLEPLLAAGTDPWLVWSWLTTPAALLGGAVPHEAARDADERPLVEHAAVRLAERG
ncbi:hypothetical protein GCM10009623_12550 [Nocardioides aestuarii]|uniref:Uncharacterized protein n=1 Tax=Nocardioides aestuarii TaxID=252231 RepID=A0ABW4TIC9_9ACTN